MIMKNKQLPSGLLMFTGVSICVLTMGSLFRFFHWPGGGKILFVGLLAMIICCIWWLVNMKNLPLRDKFVSFEETKNGKYWQMLYSSFIIISASIAVTCAGIVLKLIQYPGAVTIIMVGAMTVAIMALYMPFLYIKGREDDNQAEQDWTPKDYPCFSLHIPLR